MTLGKQIRESIISRIIDKSGLLYDLTVLAVHFGARGKRYKLIPRLNGRILEIGCGRGEFLQYLPSTYQKYGVEINKLGIEHIRQNYKDITVFTDRIDSPTFNPASLGTYDIIIMWHVLEHIEDPIIFFQNISKLLSEKGVLLFGFLLLQ